MRRKVLRHIKNCPCIIAGEGTTNSKESKLAVQYVKSVGRTI